MRMLSVRTHKLLEVATGDRREVNTWATRSSRVDEDHALAGRSRRVVSAERDLRHPGAGVGVVQRDSVKIQTTMLANPAQRAHAFETPTWHTRTPLRARYCRQLQCTCPGRGLRACP